MIQPNTLKFIGATTLLASSMVVGVISMKKSRDATMRANDKLVEMITQDHEYYTRKLEALLEVVDKAIESLD